VIDRELKLFKLKSKTLIMGIISTIKFYIRNYKWAKASPNEKAEMMRDKFYHLGKNVELYTSDFGTEPYLISIGDNVTVAAHARFINHDVSCFNVARYLNLPKERLDKVGAIVLHDNCFIGAYATLLPGASIGKNSIIASGSIVSSVIPDNEVWGGIPAKFIMTTEEYAQKVLKRAESYPWKYKDGKLLHLPTDELIKLRQEFLFEEERKKSERLKNKSKG